MIIALVRHGQTDYNLTKRIQGKMDNPLNETGMLQMKNTANHLKAYDPLWDTVGSSHLIRAKTSAQIIRDTLENKASFIEPLLTERDFGPYEGKPIETVHPLLYLDDHKEEGFENNSLLLARIKEGLLKIYETYKDKKVLFICHAHVIKSALILHDPIEYHFMNHYINNSSVYYFKIEKEKISFIKKIDLEDK